MGWDERRIAGCHGTCFRCGWQSSCTAMGVPRDFLVIRVQLLRSCVMGDLAKSFLCFLRSFSEKTASGLFSSLGLRNWRHLGICFYTWDIQL